MNFSQRQPQFGYCARRKNKLPVAGAMVMLLKPLEFVMLPPKLPQLVDARFLLVWRTKFHVPGQKMLALPGPTALMPNFGGGGPLNVTTLMAGSV